MSSGLYTEAFAKYGMEACVPTEEDQKTIHGVIFPHLQEGIVLPEEKDAVLGIARRMITQTGADSLVLGCTELPLIIGEGDLEVPLLDTTQIHIQKIVELISA
jgi:aspartate racemase